MQNAPVPTKDDATALAILRTAFYAFGAIAIVWCLTIIGMTMTVVMTPTGAGLNMALPFFMAAIHLLIAGTYAATQIYVGRSLANYKNRDLALFVGGTNFFILPFGCLLALYAWRVLSRPSVRELFMDSELQPAAIAKKAGLSQPVAAIAPWHEAIPE